MIALVSLSATLGLAVAAAAAQPNLTVPWGTGLSLQLGVAGMARAPVVLVAFVGLAVAGYALGYGDVQGRARMVGLLVTFVGAMELLLLAGDWLTLLSAWELVGILSWALIAHHWRQNAPTQASQAFLSTRVGDLGLFVAAGGAFAATGSLDFSALRDASGGWATVIVVGVLVAAVLKSAQLPFSPWLFSAMAGPTPASALLHSATMVAAGAYLLARLHPFPDTVSWFAPVAIAIGLGTALAGGVVALTQPEAKKLLAASTSAHYGLMFVAVGAGYPSVAIAHLVAHGLFKALLFISAGVAIDTSGSTRLADMRLGRRLPAIAGFTLVGSLALAAVPPLGGAWTKEQIVAAAGERAPCWLRWWSWPVPSAPATPPGSRSWSGAGPVSKARTEPTTGPGPCARLGSRSPGWAQALSCSGCSGCRSVRNGSPNCPVAPSPRVPSGSSSPPLPQSLSFSLWPSSPIVDIASSIRGGARPMAGSRTGSTSPPSPVCWSSIRPWRSPERPLDSMTGWSTPGSAVPLVSPLPHRRIWPAVTTASWTQGSTGPHGSSLACRCIGRRGPPCRRGRDERRGPSRKPYDRRPQPARRGRDGRHRRGPGPPGRYRRTAESKAPERPDGISTTPGSPSVSSSSSPSRPSGDDHMLSAAILVPLLGAIVLMLRPTWGETTTRWVTIG